MNEILLTPLTPAPGIVEVTLVTSLACHFCDDALERLGGLEHRGLLRLTTIPSDSPVGQVLIGQHRPRMFPLILLEGNYFHDGRLPRGKFARLTVQLEATH